jgi:hypothetical protein
MKGFGVFVDFALNTGNQITGMTLNFESTGPVEQVSSLKKIKLPGPAATGRVLLHDVMLHVS